MKRTNVFTLCIVLVALITGLGAENPEWLWVTASSANNTQAITVCSGNNSYIIGDFSGTATFGTLSVTSNGFDDIYAAKLDANGNYLWVVNAGGAAGDYGYDIAVDVFGNVYITGYFDGAATFGSTTLTSNGGTDIFAAKLNNDGVWQWAVNAGSSAEDKAYGIDVDATGNAYITGYFGATSAFGETSLTSYGFSDIFVAKLDTDGNWQWAEQAGSPNMDYAYGIDVDTNGNVYLTGTFRYTGTFGSLTATCIGTNDVFAAKLDTDGDWIWLANGGGDSSYGDTAFSIVADVMGNAYVTGEFYGTATFGSSTFTSSGWQDAFVGKIDGSGNWLWAVRAGGTSSDTGQDIAVDTRGNTYLTGFYKNTIDLGTLSLIGYGLTDIFAAKLDTAGNWIWAVQAGSPSNDSGRGVALDANCNIYLQGVFSGIANFGAFQFTSAGFDIYTAKLSPDGTAVIDETIPQLAESSYLSNAWPNPALPGKPISINAKIANAETGYVSVFNLRGQCLAKYPLQPGANTITLNTNELPAGIYFYQLKTQSTKSVKKLILLQ
ncbi:MAG: SBBP repeat-containing protein [Candidatus Cloacimonetes bacterium]|nr:SBBP repeat-containing protein [Candidatus Cloacimonadota bacterium]